MTTNPANPTNLHPTEEQLNDFVDAALNSESVADGDVALVRRHLEICAVCRQEVAELRALVVQASQLPRSVAPSRDLWPELLRQFEGAPADSRAAAETAPAPEIVALPPRRAARHPLSGYWLPLAAAAVALIVLSSSITGVLLKPGGLFAPAVVPTDGVSKVLLPRIPVIESAAVVSHPGIEGSDQPHQLGAAEVTFEKAAADLRAAFEARKGQLRPKTVATVEENLAIIDGALRRARAALEADPGNPDLNSMVTSTWQKKVELLEKAVRLSSEI